MGFVLEHCQQRSESKTRSRKTSQDTKLVSLLSFADTRKLGRPLTSEDCRFQKRWSVLLVHNTECVSDL